MTKQIDLGGSVTLPGTSLSPRRTGCGKARAMTGVVRSPNILLIPGTSSVAHLRENLAAAKLQLPSETIASLNTIGEGR